MTCQSLDQRGEYLDDPIAFGDTIRPVLADIEHAGTRLGQPGRDRAEISAVLRRLVFMRDEFTCRWCGNRRYLTPQQWNLVLTDPDGAPFQLDHIVPHAADGCDHAHNLRVLCRTCNETRSNFATDRYARALPVTEQCTPCQVSHLQRIAELEDWDFDLPTMPRGPRHMAYCGTCRLVSWASEEGLLL